MRRERSRLLEELSTLSHLLRGSCLERFSTCSRPNCSCHTGLQHGPRAYLVVARDQSQRQVYISQTQVRAVRKGIQQYHRLLEIVDRITAINIQLMKGRVLDEPIL
ncbi:MAG: DUF6788 family protein [Candidatus Omnitrophota bacterium]